MRKQSRQEQLKCYTLDSIFVCVPLCSLCLSGKQNHRDTENTESEYSSMYSVFQYNDIEVNE